MFKFPIKREVHHHRPTAVYTATQHNLTQTKQHLHNPLHREFAKIPSYLAGKWYPCHHQDCRLLESKLQCVFFPLPPPPPPRSHPQLNLCLMVLLPWGNKLSMRREKGTGVARYHRQCPRLPHAKTGCASLWRYSRQKRYSNARMTLRMSTCSPEFIVGQGKRAMNIFPQEKKDLFRLYTV